MPGVGESSGQGSERVPESDAPNHHGGDHDRWLGDHLHRPRRSRAYGSCKPRKVLAVPSTATTCRIGVGGSRTPPASVASRRPIERWRSLLRLHRSRGLRASLRRVVRSPTGSVLPSRRIHVLRCPGCPRPLSSPHGVRRPVQGCNGRMRALAACIDHVRDLTDWERVNASVTEICTARKRPFRGSPGPEKK